MTDINTDIEVPLDAPVNGTNPLVVIVTAVVSAAAGFGSSKLVGIIRKRPSNNDGVEVDNVETP